MLPKRESAYSMKEDNIQYRIRRARETYRDAEMLLETGSINSCVNRLYYAAFYASVALLLTKGIRVKSHAGVKQKLGEEFFRKGLLSREQMKTYSLLSDYRHKDDYDDLFDFSREIAERMIEPVKLLIDRVEELIIDPDSSA